MGFFHSRKPDEYNWSNICNDENIELQWLQSIQTTGCALIHAVPLEDPAVGEVANRIGVMRHSNFGDLFDVQVDFDPVSNSNTGLKLPPHTDLPTREYQPGMQLLHCLVNDVQGGNSILVDGFRVAEEIRENIRNLMNSSPQSPGILRIEAEPVTIDGKHQ